jgi:DnaJ-class molecular chaperone
MKNRHGISKFKLLRFIILLTLLFAFVSCEKKIKCKHCNGAGLVWTDYDYRKCESCKGSGKKAISKKRAYITPIALNK